MASLLLFCSNSLVNKIYDKMTFEKGNFCIRQIMKIHPFELYSGWFKRKIMMHLLKVCIQYLISDLIYYFIC